MARASLTREVVLKIGACVGYASPFRVVTFPGVVVGVNDDGTFDIDVAIIGMGNIDGRASMAPCASLMTGQFGCVASRRRG